MKKRKNPSLRRGYREATPIEKTMGKGAQIKKVPPSRGTKGRGHDPLWRQDPVNLLSEMEKLSIQLDLAAEVPPSVIARKFSLTLSQVKSVGRMKLNMTGQLAERLDGMTTRLVGHAAKMLDHAEEPEKIRRASLAQVSLAAGIALDKAIAIDKHLHGTRDVQGDLILEFGSREALEKAVVRKLKDNPAFKLMTAREVPSQVVTEGDSPSAGDSDHQVEALPSGKDEQLELFPGTEEKKGTKEVPTLLNFSDTEEVAPSLLRRTKQSRADRVKDEKIEEDLDENWD